MDLTRLPPLSSSSSWKHISVNINRKDIGRNNDARFLQIFTNDAFWTFILQLKEIRKKKKIKIKEINVQFFFSHNKIRFFHVDLASGMSDDSETCGWIIRLWKIYIANFFFILRLYLIVQRCPKVNMLLKMCNILFSKNRRGCRMQFETFKIYQGRQVAFADICCHLGAIFIRLHQFQTFWNGQKNEQKWTFTIATA